MQKFNGLTLHSTLYSFKMSAMDAVVILLHSSPPSLSPF